MGQEWTVAEERGRLVYQDEAGLLDLPAPRLFGRHQFDNAGTAIAALRVVRAWGCRHKAFEQGVSKADWPARLQRLSNGKLSAFAPPGSEIWLDGGHNVDGGRIIAAALADLEERVSRPLVLIIGMLATKDAEGFLRNFTGLTRKMVALPIHQDKALSADTLTDIARKIGIPAERAETIEGALSHVAQLGLIPPPRILITGSLYLAGEVLAANGTPPS